jgi:hypothetical protein
MPPLDGELPEEYMEASGIAIGDLDKAEGSDGEGEV